MASRTARNANLPAALGHRNHYPILVEEQPEAKLLDRLDRLARGAVDHYSRPPREHADDLREQLRRRRSEHRDAAEGLIAKWQTPARPDAAEEALRSILRGRAPRRNADHVGFREGARNLGGVKSLDLDGEYRGVRGGRSEKRGGAEPAVDLWRRMPMLEGKPVHRVQSEIGGSLLYREGRPAIRATQLPLADLPVVDSIRQNDQAEVGATARAGEDVGKEDMHLQNQPL